MSTFRKIINLTQSLNYRENYIIVNCVHPVISDITAAVTWTLVPLEIDGRGYVKTVSS